jgi:transposase-like protein
MQMNILAQYNRLNNWATLIADCLNSGLTKREWCRQNGIKEHVFYYWLKKVRAASADSFIQAHPELEELQNKKPDPIPTQEADCSKALEAPEESATEPEFIEIPAEFLSVSPAEDEPASAVPQIAASNVPNLSDPSSSPPPQYSASQNSTVQNNPAIEIFLNGAAIRLSNCADPNLVSTVIRSLL